MAGTDNTLTIKFDKDTNLPLLEGLGKSAYAIAVAHGFQGTEQEWLNSLRGPKGDPGDKGDPFKFSDFTSEQLNAIKGKKGDKGDPGSVEQSARFLKEHGIWLQDTNVDTVLKKIIELSNCYNNFVPRDLEFVQPAAGATYIDFTGEPHFKLSINDGEKREFQSDNMRIAIDDSMKGNIKVDYYDLVDELVTTHIITVANATVQGPDMGAFVKDVQLSTSVSGNKLKGVGKVYAKGVQLIPTEFSTQYARDLSDFQRSMIGQATNDRNVDIVEVDYTKVSNSDASKGVIINTLDLSTFYTFGTIILKVNKSQVMTQGAGPFAPDTIGQSDTITFQSAGGPPGVPRHKVQINGSKLIQVEDGKTYTYHFSTDQITSA